MPYSEDSLQGRLLAGDKEALRQVSRWVAESMTAARFWRLRPEWQDLHQEALLRLFESLKRERFRSDGEFKSYVQGICRHMALDRLAELARRPSADMSNNPAGNRSAGDTEDLLISEHLVRRILDDSAMNCREMIRAYFLEGMSYAELASKLDVPVGTAKSRLFRCLQCLRESMAQAAPGPARGKTTSQ